MDEGTKLYLGPMMEELSEVTKHQHGELITLMRRQHAEVIDRLNTAAYYERRTRWVVATAVISVIVTLVMLKILGSI